MRYAWRLEDNLRVRVISWCHRGPGDQTQPFVLAALNFLPLSHLDGTVCWTLMPYVIFHCGLKIQRTWKTVLLEVWRNGSVFKNFSVFPENPDWIPSTHMAIHNLLKLLFQDILHILMWGSLKFKNIAGNTCKTKAKDNLLLNTRHHFYIKHVNWF